eukprot:TRINITY_DN88729_c0_g1_i1.p1 TRINITY_DN88729_c0_g1~~TRINITY_DN88729_c0_g1_i1.p1  ORF type:complete len:532 (+),score=81.62 TRINITY_DN88729_c0_g1_i1:9-1604(+)
MAPSAGPDAALARERCPEAPQHGMDQRRRFSGALGDFGGVVFIFLLLIATSSMVNFDSGGTAAVLVKLSLSCEDPKLRPKDGDRVLDRDVSYPCLDQTWKGYLGASPYVGLCCGCPVVGFLLGSSSSPMNEKQVVLTFVTLNAAATFVFAFQTNKNYMVAAKFIIGFTQAAICIYSPMWVAAFAPAANKTLWYGLFQSAAAIGNLIGYAVCGYLLSSNIYYQWGFRFQAVYLALSCVVLLSVPSSRICASQQLPMEPPSPSRPNPADGARWSLYLLPEQLPPIRRSRMYHLWEPLRLLRHGLFATTLMTLTALFFVVTAIQYWSSEFFVEVFQRDELEVTNIFIFVSATAPIAGVVIGSAAIDKFGGTATAEAVSKTCNITFLWGVAASIAGWIAAVISPEPRSSSANARFFAVVAGIWVQLFFGGAMLPAISGISLEAVPREQRGMASSFTQLVCNVFGYVLGSLLPGKISQTHGLHTAMQVSFSWASLGCLSMYGACWIAKNQKLDELKLRAAHAGDSVELSATSGAGS